MNLIDAHGAPAPTPRRARTALDRHPVLSACVLACALSAAGLAQTPTVRFAADLETRGVNLEFRSQIFAGPPSNYAALLTRDAGNEPWTFSRNATTLVQLADIQPGAGGSAPEFLVQFRGRSYFTANTPRRGRELWSTDGTAAGTKLSVEVMSGDRSSDIRSIAILGSKIFFAADDWPSGRELWSWDGSKLERVVDLNPGSQSGVNGPVIAAHGKLWLSGINGPLHRGDLYVSDGTAAGTKLVPDQAIAPSGFVNEIVAGPNGTVLYAVPTGTWATIYSTDGTAANTRRVFNGIKMSAMQPVGNRVVFTSADAQYQPGIYSIENNRVRRLVGGELKGRPIAFGSKFYFNTTKNELWESDGTPAGTRRFLANAGVFARLATRLILGTSAGVESYDPQSQKRELLVRDATRFLGVGATGLAWILSRGNTVYSSDGTAAGTQVVSLIRQSASSAPTQFVPLGERALVRARVGQNTQDSYFSIDRRTLTPRQLGLVSKAQGEAPRAFRGLLWGRGEIQGLGVELVGMDPATLAVVTRIDVDAGPSSSFPDTITPAGRVLYFMTRDDSLYVSNGKAGLRKLGTFPGRTHEIRAWGERAIVTVHRDWITDDELWVVDPSGATRIAKAPQIQVCATRARDFSYLVSTSLEDQRVFLSDGSVSGTRRLYTSFDPATGTPIAAGVALGDRYVHVHGTEMWSSFGTSASTQRIRSGSWSLSKLVAIDDARAAFVVSSNRGSELHITDGTSAGSRMLVRYPQNTPIENLARHGQGWLSYTTGLDLYVSNGTTSGTYNLGRYLEKGQAYALAQVGDRLLFSGYDATRGLEPHAVTGLGAMTQVLGESCGRGSRAPCIRSQAPKIGAQVTVSVTNGPNAGVAIFGIGRHSERGFAGPDACWIHFDLRAPISVLTAPLASGSASRTLRIPNDPTLRGLSLGLQALAISSRGTEASAGLLWFFD